MTTMDEYIININNDYERLRENIHKITTNGVSTTNENEVRSEITYILSQTNKKLSEFEEINKQILNTIQVLNKQNKDKQQKYKELQQQLQSNKNIGLGMKVALEDNRYEYNSIFKNIILKVVVCLGWLYYIKFIINKKI